MLLLSCFSLVKRMNKKKEIFAICWDELIAQQRYTDILCLINSS